MFLVVVMVVFSITLACVVRTVRDEIKIARKYTHSILGLIAIVIGLSALQVCGVGGVCVAGVGYAIVSLIFPGIFLNFLSAYSLWIIVFSIISQLAVLYFMKCYKNKI